MLKTLVKNGSTQKKTVDKDTVNKHLEKELKSFEKRKVISGRLCKGLARGGINTVGELLKASDKKLESISRFGSQCLEEAAKFKEKITKELGV